MTSNGQWRPRANPWAIAVVVAMAAFMEVLDTSIANVSLPHMAGSLGDRPRCLRRGMGPRRSVILVEARKDGP